MTILRWLETFRRDERGVAAVEMGLTGTILLGLMLNGVEVGRYAYTASQVTAASQAAAQAALVQCTPVETPVSTNCPEAAEAMAQALQGTSLGEEVKRVGNLDEAWYCLDDKGVLTRVADPGSKPSNCTAAGMPAAYPALYLKITAGYTYTPMFPGITLAEKLPAEIQRTAWMRMR